MKEIIFSGLGLKLNVNSVAISIFGVDIYWYAILIVSAFVIAIILCKKDDKKYGIDFENILEVLIIVIPISIICARMYYVLFDLS